MPSNKPTPSKNPALDFTELAKLANLAAIAELPDLVSSIEECISLADKGINNEEDAKFFSKALLGTVNKATKTICDMIMQGFPVAAPVALVISQIIGVLTTLAMAILELVFPKKEQNTTLEAVQKDNALSGDKPDLQSIPNTIKMVGQIAPVPVPAPAPAPAAVFEALESVATLEM